MLRITTKIKQHNASMGLKKLQSFPHKKRMYAYPCGNLFDLQEKSHIPQTVKYGQTSVWSHSEVSEELFWSSNCAAPANRNQKHFCSRL